MDNLTHTLIGLVAGETVARTTRTIPGGLPEKTRRESLIAIGVIGNNLPDIDLLWSTSPITGDNMGYMLLHRGETHTLLGCVALAIPLMLAALLVLRRSGLRLLSYEGKLFAAMALFSVLLHLGMDSLNSYGVHPFWPLNNRWYYGDSVFIIEPLFWLSPAPLLFVMRTWPARIVLIFVLLVANLILLFIHAFAPAWFSVPVLVILLAWYGRRLIPRTAALVSAGYLIILVIGFVIVGRVAERQMREIASQQFPGYSTLDSVMSPVPAQPWCWDVLLVQSSSSQYVVRHGLMSLKRSEEDFSCTQLLRGTQTAPLEPVTAAAVPGMLWQNQFGILLADFIPLATEDCHARELMQFARAPFAAKADGNWILGDMRFDREPGIGFAEIFLPGIPENNCHYNVPWIPPRNDLLE